MYVNSLIRFTDTLQTQLFRSPFFRLYSLLFFFFVCLNTRLSSRESLLAGYNERKSKQKKKEKHEKVDHFSLRFSATCFSSLNSFQFRF